MGKDFKQNMNWLAQIWEEWNETEQIVALYSVVRKLNAIPTRFLQILLFYNCPLDNTTILAAEAHANDPVWVFNLLESGDDALFELLNHFPLLRPANLEVKNHYLNLIHNVLYRILANSNIPSFQLDSARHLLSYALIHPALSNEDRRSFAKYAKCIEYRFTHGLDSKESEETDDGLLCDQKIGREDESKNVKEAGVWLHLDEHFSIHSGHTNESEMNTEENSQPSSPRIKDLGAWLKSLRLHKYLSLLSSLEYEELLGLDEGTLESKGVTKGARHKIILSIGKLKERPKQLADIEKDLVNGGNVISALTHLKSILLTPMPPLHSEQVDDSEKDSVIHRVDLSSLFVRVVGKVCTQLLVSAQPEEESLSMFLNLIDKCLNHEAFTQLHVRRFLSWKQQILRLWTPVSMRVKEARHNRRWSHQYGGDMYHNWRGGRVSHRFPSWSPFSFLSSTHLSPHTMFPFPPVMASNLLPHQSSVKRVTSLGNSPLLSPQHFLSKRPSLQETPSQLHPHVTLQRTHSAPSRPHDPSCRGSQPSTRFPSEGTTHPQNAEVGADVSQQASLVKKSQMAELDITNRLESLCLSMTKHALE